MAGRRCKVFREDLKSLNTPEMSKDKDSKAGAGDIDEKMKVLVEEIVAKQVAEVVETLKVAATKETDSGTSIKTSRNSGDGKSALAS